jgi:hypothetical protein
MTLSALQYSALVARQQNTLYHEVGIFCTTYEKFRHLMAVLMKIQVLLILTSRRLVNIYRRFVYECCFLLQGLALFFDCQNLKVEPARFAESCCNYLPVNTTSDPRRLLIFSVLYALCYLWWSVGWCWAGSVFSCRNARRVEFLLVLWVEVTSVDVSLYIVLLWMPFSLSIKRMFFMEGVDSGVKFLDWELSRFREIYDIPICALFVLWVLKKRRNFHWTCTFRAMWVNSVLCENFRDVRVLFCALFPITGV